jgi:hypothetical protein
MVLIIINLLMKDLILEIIFKIQMKLTVVSLILNLWIIVTIII